MLIIKIAMLMMSGKLATSGLLKINVLWNKYYDYDVTNKIW